jgi:hypothetical protein
MWAFRFMEQLGAVESLQSADLKLTATNAALLLEGSDS